MPIELKTGCQWRMLPKGFPKWQLVYYYFNKWKWDGTIEEIHERLRDLTRKNAGRKRHIVVDTMGLLLAVVVHVQVIPKRWVVERTFAWFESYRRLSKDFEYYTETSQSMIKMAMIKIMLNRIKL
jgi:transposase